MVANLFSALPQQLAAWVLYNFAHANIDLHLGTAEPAFYSELRGHQAKSEATWSWDGTHLHGGPQRVPAGPVSRMMWCCGPGCAQQLAKHMHELKLLGPLALLQHGVHTCACA